MEIYIIDNKIHKFNLIPKSKKKIQSTSEIYLSENNKYIMKKIVAYHKYNVYKREVHIMSYLNEHVDWCPQIISTNDNEHIIIMEYCGKILSNSNIPKNFTKQLELILNDMKRLNIQHNDIKLDEVLVKNGKIYLCDYGWGSINYKHSCHIGIWHGFKPYGYRNDEKILARLKFHYNIIY